MTAEFPVAENAINTNQDKGIFEKKQSGHVSAPSCGFIYGRDA
jgi:hypothetical protein